MNEDEQPQREPTNGEVLVGLSFNPSGNEDVVRIKKAAADLIDAIQAIESKNDHPQTHFVQRATDDAISAQMFAVKAATWDAK